MKMLVMVLTAAQMVKKKKINSKAQTKIKLLVSTKNKMQNLFLHKSNLMC